MTTLPPYDPSDSTLPPLPAGEQSVKDLCSRYELSKQALYSRMSAVGVTGSKRANRTIFSLEDTFRLDAAHYYLSIGFGLKDLSETAQSFEGGVMEEDDDPIDVTSGAKTKKAKPEYTQLAIAPQHERTVVTLAEAVRAAVQSVAPSSDDPLKPYRLLREAAEARFTLTTPTIAQILGIKPTAVHSFQKEEIRLGYRLTRVGKGVFRVSELTDEEMEEAA